jgi:hypothetical protein
VTSSVQTQLDAKAPSSTAVTLTGTQTLTNKTLTSPALTTPTISTVDAKGDLLVGTADNTVDRLAAGNSGEQLVADSSTSTGLRYNSNFAAGKNAFINGAFNVWQRGTSFTNPAPSYTADRFNIDYNSGTVNCVVSQQAFTPGTAPAAGYEAQYFLRISQSAATASKFIYIGQRIEDVRTFAGQTITFSFWAKANASKTLTTRAVQVFGSGGSSAVGISGAANSITTSWARYTNTIAIPSISGKTVGTGSYLTLDFNFDSNAIQDIDTWGWQVESGSVATAFQTATGTLQGELAACQRYYLQIATGNTVPISLVWYDSATLIRGLYQMPVVMRTNPTLVQTTGTNYYATQDGDGFNSLTLYNSSANVVAWYNNTEVSGTNSRPQGINTNSASASLGLSAEL